MVTVSRHHQDTCLTCRSVQQLGPHTRGRHHEASPAPHTLHSSGPLWSLAQPERKGEREGGRERGKEGGKDDLVGETGDRE